MSVAYKRGLSVKLARYKIGGFSSHSRKAGKLLYRIRNSIAILRMKLTAHFNYVFRLGFKQSAGAYVFGHLFFVGFGKIFDFRKAFKQRRSYLIDSYVGALGGKSGGYQKLMRLFKG